MLYYQYNVNIAQSNKCLQSSFLLIVSFSFQPSVDSHEETQEAKPTDDMVANQALQPSAKEEEQFVGNDTLNKNEKAEGIKSLQANNGQEAAKPDEVLNQETMTPAADSNEVVDSEGVAPIPVFITEDSGAGDFKREQSRVTIKTPSEGW